MMMDSIMWRMGMQRAPDGANKMPTFIGYHIYHIYNDGVHDCRPATASGGFCVRNSSEGKIRHLDHQFEHFGADDHDDHDHEEYRYENLC